MKKRTDGGSAIPGEKAVDDGIVARVHEHEDGAAAPDLAEPQTYLLIPD